ncbi:hypothetical protein M405DRAFT_883575 [Rhizopogon salebrosus TDB-379]|nr:hypothetical protein M405DRAFT_883575 [Rhizopogon salebrosus TDB-379]
MTKRCTKCTKLTDHEVPKEKYFEYWKGMDISAGSKSPVPAPAATLLRRHLTMSARIKIAENKRTSEHLGSNEPSSKRLKSSDEKRDDEDEPPKEHPIVQNGVLSRRSKAYPI